MAETYVTTVEDQYTNARTILPHGASFQGPPITMHVACDSPKNEFVIVVSTPMYVTIMLGLYYPMVHHFKDLQSLCM